MRSYARRGSSRRRRRCARGSSAASATRIVATKEALRERQLGRERIAEIMQRVISHVGANELSEQEWIATALRYAEAPAASESGGSTSRPAPTVHASSS
jgi:hypothetical protein